MRTSALVKEGEVLIPRVELATGLHERMRGLLGRDGLPPQEAIWLCPCSSIHTFFMRFDLDLIFLSRELAVVRIVRGVGPGRMVHGGTRAHSVVELETGWLPEPSLRVGEVVELVSN